MKNLFFTFFSLLLLVGCNTKTSNKELELPKTTHLISINDSNYSIKYPNSWKRKGSKTNTSVNLQSNAFSSVLLNYMIVPDSVGGEKFIEDVKSKQVLESETFEKKNKKYYKLKYEPNGMSAVCEHIYHVDHNTIYSIVHTYAINGTPKDKIKEGQEILNSFVVK